MDIFFDLGDTLNRILINLKKNKNLTNENKARKEKDILNILKNLKKVLLHSQGTKDAAILSARYLVLKNIARKCLQLMEKGSLEKTQLEESENEQEETENEEETTTESDTDTEPNPEKMTTTLDLSLAMKVIDKYTGDPSGLSLFIDTIELLREYSQTVPEATIIKFLKTRLVGSAHGVIDNATTIDEVKQLLRNKFTIKLTPRAVENELKQIKQNNKTISEFGSEIEKLATKLAAAHVSNNTFATEAAATGIVEPIAVQAFISGLKNPQTQFFLRARNPETLNKAISDALECAPETPKTDNAFWVSFQPRGNNTEYWRGRGNPRSRGYSRGRGSFRGRSNFQQQQQNQQNYNTNRGRGNFQNYRPHPNNTHQNNNNNSNNSRRGRQGHYAMQVEQNNEEPRQPSNQCNQTQQSEEEVNLIQLFR